MASRIKYSIFLRTKAGANHELKGVRGTHLRNELAAGRGGVEIMKLIIAGYEGFLHTDGEVHHFEDLTASQFTTYG